MYKMRVLNWKDLEGLLPMAEVIECVEKAYNLYSSKQAALWPVIFHEFEPGIRDMDMKSGYLDGAGLFGLKMVGYAADNPKKLNAPALSGLVMVMSIETGQPVGLVDGMTITNVRTGAAGAVGAKWLARKDSQKALIVGTGAQGRAQLEGLVTVMPKLNSVTAASMDPEMDRIYVEEMSAKFPSLSIRSVPWERIGEPASTSDIIVTCTPSREGYLKKDWVKPGTHINAIGADMTLKQEIEPSLVASARLFVDSRSQTLHHGETHHAYDQGLIQEESVTEIGKVIAGGNTGRMTEEDITLFDATGMALQDIITADLALRRATERDLGTIIEM